MRTSNSNYRKLGYRDKVIVDGKEMTLSAASLKEPEKLFALVVEKSIIAADRVYQNLLDCIRSIDPNLYEAHRTSYQEEIVRKVKKIQRQELDGIIRNKLREQSINTVEVIVNDKVRKFHNASPTKEPNHNACHHTFVKVKGYFVKSSKQVR